MTGVRFQVPVPPEQSQCAVADRFRVPVPHHFRVPHGSRGSASGRSVFDLSLSGPPLAGSGAPGPPKQKTKTDRSDRYIAVTCAAGELLRTWRAKMSSFLPFLKSIIKKGQDGLGDHRTPGWIELWSPNQRRQGGSVGPQGAESRKF